jgi:hypothetical protein
MTDEMVKYALDNFDSTVLIWVDAFYQKMGDCLGKSPELLWYMVKTTPKLIKYGDLYTDCGDDILEYISKHTSYDVVEHWFFAMTESKTFRCSDHMTALFRRFPQLIGICNEDIKITEEMSENAMALNPKEYFGCCLRTPKVIRMACEASIDVFGHGEEDLDK